MQKTLYGNVRVGVSGEYGVIKSIGYNPTAPWNAHNNPKNYPKIWR